MTTSIEGYTPTGRVGAGGREDTDETISFPLYPKP